MLVIYVSLERTFVGALPTPSLPLLVFAQFLANLLLPLWVNVFFEWSFIEKLNNDWEESFTSGIFRGELFWETILQVKFTGGEFSEGALSCVRRFLATESTREVHHRGILPLPVLNFIKKLRRRCFSVNLGKYLRKTSSWNRF